jgi:NitT/TauT family transport system substrate-binding protein
MDTSPSRAAFLTAAAAVAALPRRIEAQALTKIRLGGTAANDVIGALWAQRSGIFQKYGLDVAVINASSGAAISAAVLGGSFDVGKSSVFGIITAHAKGVPFVLVAPAAVYTAEAPNTALVVAKDSTAKTGRDMNGKTLAVPGLGDLNTMTTSAWIDANGGDSRTVKFLELPSLAVAEAIGAGRIDGGALTEPQLSDALRTGKCRILGYPDDAIGKRLLVTAYFCTADYAAKNADALARFRKGVNEAVLYANAHRSEMIPVLATYSKADEAAVTSQSPALLAVPGGLDPRIIQPWIDTAVKYHVLPKAFSAKDMIDPGALTS